MSEHRKLPQGRLGRLSRLALMGVRSGAGMLIGRDLGGAEHAAQVLGTMRGLAAKVGQMASYVDGVVPESQREAYEASLRMLQSQAPRSSSAEIRARVESELGQPIDRLFAHWDDTPIASASIGQVHRARLHGGEDVAVKVQHPGIERALLADLDNAGLLEGMIGALGGKRLNTKAMLQVVRTRFAEELDYVLEAERLTAFAALHRGDDQVHVPQLFPGHCSLRVLTTAFVSGKTFEEACAADETARRRWAETMWRFVFKSLLHGRMLAADPHPGNYVFQTDGKVVFLDYGCIQMLDEERRSRARAVHDAALAGDEARFTPAALHLVDARPGALQSLARDYVRECFEPLFGSPYRITRAYASGLLDAMKTLGATSLRVEQDEFFGMPPDVLFVNRLQFGFYSVLARMDVEVDYASVERAFLSAA